MQALREGGASASLLPGAGVCGSPCAGASVPVWELQASRAHATAVSAPAQRGGRREGAAHVQAAGQGRDAGALQV